jgi:hypothetical protein
MKDKKRRAFILCSLASGVRVVWTPGGIKLAGGKPLPAPLFLGQLSKGDARRVRTALRLEGLHDEASAPRDTGPRAAGMEGGGS